MKPKGCLTGIGLLIVVLLGVSFFLPKDMNISVTEKLSASPAQLFYQINNVKNWENWSPWHRIDPEMKLIYGEKIKGEGASYTWKSDNRWVGNGAMIIDESVEARMVGTTMKFEGMDDSYADIVILSSEDGGSVVTWDLNSDYKARMPWQRYGMVFSRMMLKKSYKEGLKNLDTYIAEHPSEHEEEAASAYEIEVREVETMNVVTVHREGSIEEMIATGDSIFAEAFTEVMDIITEEGLQMAGPALALASEWNPETDTYKMDIGIPVMEGGSIIPGGTMAVASYYGPYEGTGAAHEAVYVWAEANGYTPGGPARELYITDPVEQPDTALWLTEVMYPITK